MGAGLQAHERRVRAQQEHPADGARRAAAYASVVRYSAWPFSDWKFSRNQNGFVGSGGRDLNFFLVPCQFQQYAALQVMVFLANQF